LGLVPASSLTEYKIMWDLSRTWAFIANSSSRRRTILLLVFFERYAYCKGSQRYLSHHELFLCRVTRLGDFSPIGRLLKVDGDFLKK
jgi:hypothetical protein